MDTLAAPNTATGSARTVADQLARIRRMIEQGHPRAATRAAAGMLDTAPAEAVAVLAQVADVLERGGDDLPRLTTALDDLLWTVDGPEAEAILDACRPEQDYRAGRLEPAPRSRLAVRFVPATPVHRGRGPARTGQGVSRDVEQYFTERAPEQTDDRRCLGQDRGEEFDYDAAGLRPLVGESCVLCGCERTRADQPRNRWDDGLCAEHRDDGCEGIPALAPGFTPTEKVEAWCAFFAAADATGRGGRPRLRAFYRRHRDDRFRRVVARWVDAHPVN